MTRIAKAALARSSRGTDPKKPGTSARWKLIRGETARRRTSDPQTVRVQAGGAVTIPKAIRDRHGIETGTPMSVLDVEGVLVFSPAGSTVATLSDEIARHRDAAGLTDDDVVAALRGERERIAQERAATVA